MIIEFLHQPDFWFWILMLGSIIIMIWYIIYYKSEKGLSILPLLRSFLVVILLIGLLQPNITQIIQGKKMKELSVFVDNSMSMGYHTRNSLTRLNEDLSFFGENLKNKGIKHSIYYFDQSVYPVINDMPLTAAGSTTNIGEIIKIAKNESPEISMGYLMITDGQNTLGIDPKQSLKDVSIPIFSLGVGDKSALVDVSIKSVDAPTVAVKNEDIEIIGTVESLGDMNKRLTVSLYDKNKLIGSKFIRVLGDGSQTNVRFRFNPDQLGQSLYTMKISSIEDELNIDNNQHSFSISILKDQYNVAILTGAPSYNTGVLKQILNRMSRISVNHFIQHKKEFRPGLKEFWEKKYELIILDNFPVSQMSISWYSFLKKKIGSQKSSLAWIAGPSIQERYASMVFSILGLKDTKWMLEDKLTGWIMTSEGKNIIQSFGIHPDFILRELEFPPLNPGLQISYQHSWMYPLASFKNDVNAPVLLTGETNNVRMAVWTPTNLHALHYNLTSTQSEGFSEILLSGLFSWLLRTGGNETLHFRLNKNNYQQGEEIQISGIRHSESAKGESALFYINVNDSIVSSTELQFNPLLERWEGSLWASSPGTNEFIVEYQDNSGTYEQKGKFYVEKSQVELNKVFLNEELLKYISGETGGEYHHWANMDSMITHLNPKITLTTESNKTRPFEKWWIVVILISILSLEWGIRRKFGFL